MIHKTIQTLKQIMQIAHKKLTIQCIIWSLVLFSPLTTFALDVTGYRVEEGEGYSRMILECSEKPDYSVFTLENPDRLVVDLSRAKWRVTKRPPGLGQLISSVRYGIHADGKIRVVLDLSRAIAYKDFVLSPTKAYGYQLVIDMTTARKGEEQTNLAVTTEEKEEVAPNPTEGIFAVAPTPERKPIQPQELQPLIIIDAGHGGHDPGAIGRAGTKEKFVTLGFAKTLAAALQETGRYRVALTRDNDRFIELHKRVAIARNMDGDLFISLHADSHDNPSVRGLSVYTLSETASDKEAARLARHANDSAIITGVDLTEENSEVAGLLIDMVQRDTKNMSSSFAELVKEELGQDIRLLEHTHRFAGFRVLTAADIPSVLIELGYLSNRTEEELLTTDDYKEKIVQALVRAIDRQFML
jgi:N-acetylmuramoyl-L-alanine amidase